LKLNIIYDDEYDISYCIWLIISERSKHCVLAVLAVWQHFSQKVAKRFCRKLLSVKSRSNQPALWTPYTSTHVTKRNVALLCTFCKLGNWY
jgi:hypothetical protein